MIRYNTRFELNAVANVAVATHGILVPVVNEGRAEADTAALAYVRVSSPVNCHGTSAAMTTPARTATTTSTNAFMKGGFSACEFVVTNVFSIFLFLSVWLWVKKANETAGHARSVSCRRCAGVCRPRITAYFTPPLKRSCSYGPEVSRMFSARSVRSSRRRSGRWWSWL